MEQDIINDYQERIAAAQQQVSKYKGQINAYSFMRLGLFGVLLLGAYLARKQDNFTILAVTFVILLFCFAWLVSKQSKFEQEKKYFEHLAQVIENEIASITSHANLYDTGQRFGNDKHYYSADLDIFGSASLYQLINRSATVNGNNKLGGWFNAPSAKDMILMRQDAIKELSGKNSWKLDLQASLFFARKEDEDQLRRLFAYLNLPLSITGEQWLTKYIKIAPFLLLAAVIAAFFNVYAKDLAVLIGFINIGIVFSKGERIKKIGSIADEIDRALSAYAKVFKKVEEEQWQSALCSDLAGKLTEEGVSKKIQELAVFINKLNSSMVMILGFILNLFFLSALKQTIAIENWKRDNHESLEAAFDVIAEFEALISLASLTINYPKWCIPQIADGNGYTLSAKNIGHPLIYDKSRIDNNYKLDNAFHIDIITGSNMAGKSTFLRTMGINTVLALCGAPVCADAMHVSVITIITYMRIKDSLNESTSTFKAELDRLQMLLAAVETAPKVFFLIDEMLRGTNSVDKYLGSKAVIEQLIRKKAVGMVATHDLQIAQLEKQYPDYVRNFYFDIQVKDGEMLFDYKIKDGECKTFNASLLLKQIGIDINAESLT
jgi:hypothetical protein